MDAELRQSEESHGKRVLTRLRRRLMGAVAVGVGLWALYSSLVARRPLLETGLGLLVGALLGYGLVHLSMQAVVRFNEQAVAERQQLAARAMRGQQLHTIWRRVLDPSETASEKGQAFALDRDGLSAILEDLAAVFDAQQGSLLLLDGSRRPRTFVAFGLPATAETGYTSPVPTLEDLPEEHPEQWAEWLMPGTTADVPFFATPIVAGERLWGYLALTGQFLAEDKALLRSFATDLAAVLEQAALVQKTQDRLVEATGLAEMGRTFAATLNQEDLVRRLAHSLTRMLDGTGCLVFLRRSRVGELSVATAYGAYEEPPLPSEEYSALVQALVATQRPIMIERVEESAYFASDKMAPLPDRSVLGLPVIVQDQAIGAAVVGETRKYRCFTESEIEQATVVVNQAAVAIANARLFREVEQRLVELGTLAEISRVIFSPLEIPEIYRHVVDELARAFGYPFVAFYRVEEQGLALGAQVGYEEWELPVYLPWGHGFIGNVAATGQTGYVPDTTAQEGQSTTAEGVVSQMAVPVRKNGRVLGVLSVESHDLLTEADLSLLQSVSYQVGTAIENARLYAAEQREREVARTLLQIASDLSGTLHLEEVLDLILERLRVVVSYDGAAIGLLAGTVCHITATRGWTSAETLWSTGLASDQFPLLARVLDERTAVIVPDTRASSEWVEIEGEEDVRSWLGVPLVVQDRAIGLLMLSHGSPGFYDQEASQVALAFAQHAALALDNARLYEQAQSALREQTLLREMTTAVSATLDAGQVLRMLAERLVVILGVTSVRIAVLDDEWETANLVAEHLGPDASGAEQESDVGSVYRLSALPVTGAKLMAREPLLVTSVDELDEWQEAMSQRDGKTLLLLPLIARDRVTGFVELWDSRSRRQFTEKEIALAQTLINPAAVAIDNARLFAETQRSISEMMLLYDIAVSAASTLELDTVLQSVVKTLQFRVLERSAVYVWLLDEPRESLELRGQAGELSGLIQRDELPLEDELCGRVVRTGEPILIQDAQRNGLDAPYGGAVRSILCVPLAWGQRVVGVLQALSAQESAYSNHDLRLLRTMAGSLAIAIENVRLFAQLRRSEEALTMRNQALKRVNERLQELDRLKSAFVANVSHELRTPLNSIIGFSEVLLDGLAGEVEPMAREYLGYIHDSGKHLLDLINDILDLSRIQAGRMKLTLEEVDVLQVVEEVRTTLAPMIARKRQVFSVEPESPWPTIIGDRMRIKQILLNLVGNACKFTQDKGEITVRAFLADPTALRIDVVDNGPGIPLEDQAVIFEEFRQARSTQPGEGTGLGLAITRRLINLHGGRIWVESQLGAGATFTILLPLAGPEEDGEEGEEGGQVL